MSKSLSVKVETKKVIAALEATLVKKQDAFDKQDEARAQHEKEVEKYNAALMKLIKSGKGKVTSANRSHWRMGSNSPTISVSAELVFPRSALPAEPVAPNEIHEYRHKNEVEEITNAVRVLKMTDQEYVNASTMAKVSQYL